MATISSSINEHKNPSIYRYLPFLLRVQHWFQHKTTLRNWYVMRDLRARLRSLPPTFRYMDAGCGAGDMILPFIKRYPRAGFVGIDRGKNNVETCQRYASFVRAKNTTFSCQSVEEPVKEKPFDLISCITVLHYVERDREALKNFHDSLVPGGRLLLYSPITYKRYFGWYKHLRETVFSGVDYDTIQGIQRNYTIEELRQKLNESGFEIEKVTFSYGNAGRIAYEMQSTVILSMQMLPVWLTPIYFLLGLVLVYPFVILMMILDFLRANKEGNGTLIVAKRPE